MVGRPQTRERLRVEAEQAEHLAAIGQSPNTLALPSARRTSPAEWSEDLPHEAMALGAQGFSEAEIGAHWGLSLEELTKWGMDKPGFGETLARARTAAQAWWESRARIALRDDNNRFPAGAWAGVMRARFAGYQDRLEIASSVDLMSRLVLVDLRTPSAPGALDLPARAEPRPLVGPDAFSIELHTADAE